MSSFSPLVFIQRLHEAEAALKKAEQEKEALLVENAMLKVEVGNLKQAAADKPRRKTNPFAVEDKPRRTNPFAPAEDVPKRKTNPFAAEASAWVDAAEQPSYDGENAEENAESMKESMEENATENAAENTAENAAENTEEAEARVSVTRPPRRQPLLRRQPLPRKAPRAPRAPRAPKAPKAPKVKPETKPDAWAMSAEKEAALRRQYASLCDGDNGVNVATLQEECENLGLDEATGRDM